LALKKNLKNLVSLKSLHTLKENAIIREIKIGSRIGFNKLKKKSKKEKHKNIYIGSHPLILHVVSTMQP